MPRSNEGMRLIFSAVVGVMLGYLFGISFPTVNITKVDWHTCLSCFSLSYTCFREGGKTLIECVSQLHFPSSIISYIEDKNSGITTQTLLNHAWASANNRKKNSSESNTDEIPKVLQHTTTLLCCYISCVPICLYWPKLGLVFYYFSLSIPDCSFVYICYCCVSHHNVLSLSLYICRYGKRVGQTFSTLTRF
jgi:hypothetical protein